VKSGGSMDSTLNPGCVRQGRGNGPERVATPDGLAGFEVPSVQPLDEVFIRRDGQDVILSPRPRDWRSYLESAPVASDALMIDVEELQLPVQEREP